MVTELLWQFGLHNPIPSRGSPCVKQAGPKHTVPPPTQPPRPHGEFFHQPGRKYYDFGKIREEIQNATDVEAGTQMESVGD